MGFGVGVLTNEEDGCASQLVPHAGSLHLTTTESQEKITMTVRWIQHKENITTTINGIRHQEDTTMIGR